MPLGNKLKLKGPLFPRVNKSGPVWAGPGSKGDNGGVTFSLLSRYLVCPERFRLKVIEGLRPAPKFEHRLEYGSMWHACEEAVAAGRDWRNELAGYTARLQQRYPTQREQVDHWANVCAVQFPVYLQFWEAHPDVVGANTLEQEKAFSVPYKLPSGRVAYLRGKRDRVNLIDGGVYLQENKTKGDINEPLMKRQLTFDLQTMMYLTALVETQVGKRPVRGVRYNVVRRPLSGGEGQITQRKGSKNVPAETSNQFYARLRGVIDGTGVKQTGEPYQGPAYWFMRWKVEVSPGDHARFRRECLDPVLENLLDDYEWWYHCHSNKGDVWDYEARRRRFPLHAARYYRRPFGVYNVLDEGGASELDEYLHTGSELGLVRTAELFPELQ